MGGGGGGRAGGGGESAPFKCNSSFQQLISCISVQFSSFYLPSSIIILITIIIMHLTGSPGSNFAYLKDCFKEWSKKLCC